MKKIWWAQVKAVIRLEMRKTFFARRGLWIYVVAMLPVLLFIAFAVVSANHRAKMASMAEQGEKPLTYQDMRAIKPDMTKEEVIAILGKPPIVFHWTDRRPGPDPSGPAEEVAHESYRYSDGQNDADSRASERESRQCQLFTKGLMWGRIRWCLRVFFSSFFCGWRFFSDAWGFL